MSAGKLPPLDLTSSTCTALATLSTDFTLAEEPTEAEKPKYLVKIQDIDIDYFTESSLMHPDVRCTLRLSATSVSALLAFIEATGSRKDLVVEDNGTMAFLRSGGAR